MKWYVFNRRKQNGYPYLNGTKRSRIGQTTAGLNKLKTLWDGA